MNDIKECADEYIPIKQVAEEWKVDRTFVLKEIKAGNLEAYKIGGYKIRRSALEAYAETHKVQPK